MLTSGRRTCRVCDSERLFRYLDLGAQPLANALKPADDVTQDERVPLVLQACPQCKLSQLTHTVSPDALYTDYRFRSGVSAGWRAHCAALAATYGYGTVASSRASTAPSILDIASNDGTLLNAFKAVGCTIFGVEPSPSFADDPYEKVTASWTVALVERMKLSADVIVAQNVLGHVDDVHDFMAAIALALTPDGVALIEVPDLNVLLRTGAFDTVYHEHLSYWSVTALNTLVRAHGLALCDIERLAVHGGSLRAVVRHVGTPSPAVTAALVAELHDLRRPLYLQFSGRVTRRCAEINTALVGRDYVGFGAAAKATVLINTLAVDAYPRVVYDDSSGKQGMRIPGTQVPILAPPRDWRTCTVPLALFCWNWASDLIPRLRREGYMGPIFVPLPKPRWDYVQ